MNKIVVFMFLFAFAIFAADVKIPVQGVLSDADGNLLSGNHTITFSLYDMDVEGTSLWSEDAEIEIVNGEFSYMLGETDFIESSILENDSPLWVGVRIGDEVMSPRIELGVESKSIYSYNSGKLEGKTVEDIKGEIDSEKLNSILSRLNALETAKIELETKVANLETENEAKDERIAELENTEYFSGSYNDLSDKPDFTGWDTNINDDFDGNYNTLSNKPITITSEQVDAIIQNSSYITTHNTRINSLESKTASMTVLNRGTLLQFEGVNLQIVSGSGATDGEINGLGNLIVGYDEALSSGSDKTGSHNLIVGTKNNYSSYGGVLFGKENSVTAPYSSVIGGHSNIASGNSSSVIGGFYNVASGNSSSVIGGSYNTASGNSSSVSGGNNNTALGNSSSVSGGYNNTASGISSSVSGGANRSVLIDYNWRAGSLFENY